MKLMAINEQMEMAFTDQEVDPVSGNEVPPGSLPEEVRDDIDARLSEGEYVVPADVVRFFGVKFFEDLRIQAKTGLADMDAAGRIGGEPVGESAQGEDVSEQDLAMLEEALASSGLKAGGLVNKTLNSMASQGQTDPLVNARMNAKGMSVGFAAGGMTESLYNDTTKIDTVIDKVLAAAQTNPSLLGELSKRGVTVNTTKASMKPEDMQKANAQTQALASGGFIPVENYTKVQDMISDKAKKGSGYAPGGDVVDNMPIPPTDGQASPTTSSFNPFQFGLGFSSFGTRPMAGTQGGNATIMVDYYNPSTGETMQIPHDAVTNQPLQEVPAGFIMGVPPAVTAPTGQIDNSRKDKNDDQGPDLNAWKNKYTYSDPDALAGETLGAINKEQSSLSKFFKNSPINQFLQATAIGELKSNIDYLESRGYDSDKIAEMKAALAVRTTNRLGDPTKLGGVISYALTNTSNLTNKILEEYGTDPFDFGTTAAQREAQITAAGVAPVTSGVNKNIVSAGLDKVDATTAAIEKKLGRPATEADVDKARASGTNLLGEKLSKTEDQLTRAEKDNRKVQIDKVIEAKKKSGQLDKDGKARGGRYKGGLMQKKKKKKK